MLLPTEKHRLFRNTDGSICMIKTQTALKSGRHEKILGSFYAEGEVFEILPYRLLRIAGSGMKALSRECAYVFYAQNRFGKAK